MGVGGGEDGSAALNAAGARSVEADNPPAVFKNVRRSILGGLVWLTTFNSGLDSTLILPGTAATL